MIAYEHKPVTVFQSAWANNFGPVASPQSPLVVACRLLNKLDKLRGYGANWGTHNEPAMNQKACDRAEHFVSYFTFVHPELGATLHVYPTSGADVAIDWKLDGVSKTAVFEEAEITLLSDDQEVTYTDELALYKDLAASYSDLECPKTSIT